jgi:hypothetical protein
VTPFEVAFAAVLGFQFIGVQIVADILVFRVWVLQIGDQDHRIHEEIGRLYFDDQLVTSDKKLWAQIYFRLAKVKAQHLAPPVNAVVSLAAHCL